MSRTFHKNFLPSYVEKEVEAKIEIKGIELKNKALKYKNSFKNLNSKILKKAISPDF